MIDVGQQVRDYQIVAHLKPGGMATLFLARRVGPQGFARPVAIKVVHPHLASDPELIRMFLDEARLSACIQHPHVVHVEELGEIEGTYFLAMEYLHGDSLSSLLSALSRLERALPIETAVWIASAAAAGLHAAHETCGSDGAALGLVHRDVSPQNVLVSIDGHVKVIDFGIAKVQAGVAHTEAGVLKGKLAYMSPEQACGEPVDRRTDVYALGIVLWEMLTMRRLFSGASEVDVLDMVRSPRVVPPSSFAPAVSAALDEVVLHALAPDPRRRFATADELRHALVRAVPEGASASDSLARAVKEHLGARIEARRHEIANWVAGPRDLEVTAAPREPVRTMATARSLPRADATALAVMPFRTLSGDAAIAEGIADEVRDVLSRVRGLRVKSRNGARDAEDASAYGERLGVGFVVTGRVHADPSRVRLALALTNVEDGFQVWSEKIERTLEETWGAIDDVARAIAGALGDAKLRGERAQGDAATIDLTLALKRIVAQPVLADAGPLLALRSRAQQVAPRDPIILAASAMALARTTYWPSPPAGALEMARADAERAIELAPDLPEPWIALATLRLATVDSPGALRALRRALTNGPSVAEAYDLASRILSEADLLDEALRCAEQALWLAPTEAAARREKVRIHALRGEWAATERELAVLASESLEHYVAIEARVSLWAGRPLGPPLELAADHSMSTLLGVARRTLVNGSIAEGDRVTLEESIANAPQARARRFFHQLKVEVLLFSGEQERGIAAVVAAVDAGLEDLAWLDHCPLLRPIRQAPALAEPADRVRARAAEARRAWDEW